LLLSISFNLRSLYSYYIYFYNGLRPDFKRELILYVMKSFKEVSFDFRAKNCPLLKSKSGALRVWDMNTMFTSAPWSSVLSMENLNTMITSAPRRVNILIICKLMTLII